MVRSPSGSAEGVGAADCKGGLAAQIYAGQVLATSRLRSRGNIVVAATVAEENGCSIGLRHLLGTTLPDLGMDPKFVILGEPTGLTIGTGHDGWVGVDIEIRSPVEGVARSAGEHVFEVLKTCCDDGGFEASRAIMTIDPPRAGPTEHQFLVTIRIYRRLFPDESEEDVVCWLEGPVLRMAREMHAVVLDVKVHEEDQRLYTGHTRRIRLSVPPWSTNLMHPLIDCAREAMLAAGCRWIPKAWKLDRLGMGTAGAVASREFGIPVIGYGPGEEEQARACNESLSLPSLVDAVYGTGVLMQALSTAPLVLSSGALRAQDHFVECLGEGGSR